jgi:hypothetical protein
MEVTSTTCPNLSLFTHRSYNATYPGANGPSQGPVQTLVYSVWQPAAAVETGGAMWITHLSKPYFLPVQNLLFDGEKLSRT